MSGRQICLCNCHPDWSWLTFADNNPAFNFSDLDGIFISERRNNFLVVEWKKPGETLPEGQRQLAVGLASVPEFTVLIVHGPRSEPMQIQQVFPSYLGKIQLTDRDDFQRRARRWYVAANGE